MRIVDVLKTIKDELELYVPDALIAEGLEPFDEYVDTDPSATNKKSLAMYLGNRNSTLEGETLSVLIQLQLSGILDSRTAVLYGDIIDEQIRAHITPEMIDMTNLDSIEIDCYPAQSDAGSSYVYLALGFSSVVDDCSYAADDSC